LTFLKAAWVGSLFAVTAALLWLAMIAAAVVIWTRVLYGAPIHIGLALTFVWWSRSALWAVLAGFVFGVRRTGRPT
jgi:hypothetical protein